jgi:ankyrin repeat protein
MNIFDACKAGDLDRVQKLARNSVNVCQATEEGWTPMLIACQEDRLNIVQFLFHNGAKDDVIRTKKRWTDSDVCRVPRRPFKYCPVSISEWRKR